MENLTDYYTDINKLEEEVERLEEELESYDVQKLMVDDVKFCENKINNIPKEINRIIDTEIKKLKIRLSKNYESENGVRRTRDGHVKIATKTYCHNTTVNHGTINHQNRIFLIGTTVIH